MLLHQNLIIEGTLAVQQDAGIEFLDFESIIP